MGALGIWLTVAPMKRALLLPLLGVLAACGTDVAQNVPVKYPDAMDPDPAELDEDLPGDTSPQEGV